MDPQTAPLPQLEIRRVPLDSLHLDPANARAHGERNLASIRASLERFGQTEPLVVQASTGRVIGGNGRLTVMGAMGWTECDVVTVDVDDTQATALGIALNRTSELAEWDLDALSRHLDTLRLQGELDGVGFDESEIDDLLAGLEAEMDASLLVEEDRANGELGVEFRQPFDLIVVAATPQTQNEPVSVGSTGHSEKWLPE